MNVGLSLWLNPTSVLHGTQKSPKAFYDCSSKFYEGSNLQKLSEDVVKCSEKKCRTEKKKLNDFRKQMYR